MSANAPPAFGTTELLFCEKFRLEGYSAPSKSPYMTLFSTCGVKRARKGPLKFDFLHDLVFFHARESRMGSCRFSSKRYERVAGTFSGRSDRRATNVPPARFPSVRITCSPRHTFLPLTFLFAGSKRQPHLQLPRLESHMVTRKLTKAPVPFANARSMRSYARTECCWSPASFPPYRCRSHRLGR